MQGSVIKYEGKRGVSWTSSSTWARCRREAHPEVAPRVSDQEAAEAAMQEELHERRSSTYIEPSDETVGQLLERWLDTVARHKVKATTLEDYTLTVRKHLKPELGQCWCKP